MTFWFLLLVSGCLLHPYAKPYFDAIQGGLPIEMLAYMLAYFAAILIGAVILLFVLCLVKELFLGLLDVPRICAITVKGIFTGRWLTKQGIENWQKDYAEITVIKKLNS